MNVLRSKIFWDRVQFCDPRILYALFAIFMVVFEFTRPYMPVPVPKPVQMLYDRIEAMDTNKVVFIDCALESGIRAECQGQYQAVIEHLFTRGIKFAVITSTTWIESQKLGELFAREVETSMNGKFEEEGISRRIEYGKDYCILQAITFSGGATIQGLAKDIRSIVNADMYDTPLDDFEFMRPVKTANDIALIYRVGYTWDAVFWIGFVQSVYGTPLAIGTAGISSSSAYPFLDSEQLCGILAGAPGAAAYEGLVDSKGMGTQTVSVQSFATVYVVAAIILGNLAMFIAKRSKE
jgi:hypothetical protein